MTTQQCSCTIEKIISWLSTKHGIIIAFAIFFIIAYLCKATIDNVVLACATIAIAYFTSYLYIEAKRTREFNESPDVCVTLEKFVNKICLFVHNQGRASAKNIKISAKENITIKSGKGVKCINDISIMNISFLRVNQFFLSDLGSFEDLKTELGCNRNIVFTISYENAKNAKYENIITINICEMEDAIDNTLVDNPKYKHGVVYYASSLPIKHIVALQKQN